MKALRLNGVGKIVLEEMEDPVIQKPTDAIVKLTMSAICGTDLHAVRGTIPFYEKGTVLGHEGVGIVKQIGSDVHNFKVGDRVIIPSTIACGHCLNCKKELYALCDKANPNGPEWGTAFYGGPLSSGSFDGMQAEKVRVPYADVSLVKVPDELKDEQVILLSDILPTAYMAVENIFPDPNDTVAVFGCGPVGQLVIACLKKAGIKKIFAIDMYEDRLARAEKQGAHIINFNTVDPVTELKKLTDGFGPDKVIDAVGTDAVHPDYGFFSLIKNFSEIRELREFAREVKKVAPYRNPQGKNWIPGNAPSQVLRWATAAVAKGGVVSIIGVYTELLETFPIGQAMEKNLTITMGNCNHKKYIPELLRWVQKGEIDLVPFISHILPFDQVVHAYKEFDKRSTGWIKVAFKV